MKLIVHNDDLGLTYGFTEGIRECFKKGITTSTCIRTNGYAYKHSLSLLKKDLKGIGLGLHLNITQGPSHTKGLAEAEGHYRYGFFGYIVGLLFDEKKLLKSIGQDFEAQFEIAQSDGLKFDHLNSQDHVHMIPQIFEVVCQFAVKHKIKYVRVCDENYYLTGSFVKDAMPFFNSNLIKFIVLKVFSRINRRILEKYGLKTSENFYGVLHTNNMDGKAYIGALKDALKRRIGTVEVLSHPTYTFHENDREYIARSLVRYANSKNRDIERKTLISQKVKDFIGKNGVNLVNYKNL